MACEITQESLGPQFADVDAEIAAMYIEDATAEVLGPAACQGEKYLAWLACCLDPCLAIRRLAQHYIASDPVAGEELGEATSEAVGDVSESKADVSGNAGIYGGTPWGRSFAAMLGKFERCSRSRKHTGFAVAGRCC